MTNKRRAEYWLDQLFQETEFDWDEVEEDLVTHALDRFERLGDQFERLGDPWLAQVLAGVPRDELRAMVAERIEAAMKTGR